MLPLKTFLRKNLIKKSKLQDISIISGILVFSAALILGLFPNNIQEGTDNYFFDLILIIPVIAAIYFIFISFSRKFVSGTSDFSSSIIFKMMLAFISVAILPSSAIIIISNHIINNTVIIEKEIVHTLDESINLTNEYIQNVNKDIDNELKTIEYLIANNAINPGSYKERKLIIEQSKVRGFDCIIYSIIKKDRIKNSIKRLNDSLIGSDSGNDRSQLLQFFENINLETSNRISSISLNNKSLFLGHIIYNDYLITIFKAIPENIFNRLAMYYDSLGRYEKREFLKPYFQTNVGGAGIFLLSIALTILLVSVGLSIFLSRGIARPVLKLADAAGEVASGNFDITLNRNSQDEVGRLFRSFNTMVKQLNESRELVYHTQRLEAWKEVARRLVHEIKNPLTPIRLSAERIQNRFREGHKDIRSIILSGTETIIEEVNVLNRILSEFSGFARLPEVKVELQDLNRVIENTVNFFLGNEEISFHLNLDRSMPDIYIDKILIRQALTNIIQNSIDALENKGNIHIKTEMPEESSLAARISVKDDGPGIKAADINRIFDPAFTTKENGTGLGLAIVEKIILEHRAKIYYIPGNGAEFVIDFPVHEQPK